MVDRYVGLTSERAPSLKNIGRVFGVTRERVRQICNVTSFAESAVKPFAPVIDSLLARLDRRAPVAVDIIEEELRANHCIRRKTRLAGILRIAAFLGRSPSVVIVNHGRSSVLVQASHAELIERVIKAIGRACGKAGLAALTDVLRLVNDTPGVEISMSDLITEIDFLPNVRWLDKKRATLCRVGDNRERNPLGRRIRRILSICPTIHATHLRRALRRDPRIPIVPPASTLARFCDALRLARVSDGLLTALRTEHPEALLRGDELVVVMLLLKHGPLLPLQSLWTLARSADVGRPSFWRVIQFCTTIERCAPGMYGLVGTYVAPEIPEIAKRSRIRPRPLISDHGWTQSGTVWVSYRLSTNALDTGILPIPKSKAHLLQGQFSVSVSKNAPRVTVNVNRSTAWGLLQAFRRRNLHANDEIVLDFDVRIRELTIHTGRANTAGFGSTSP